MVEMVTLDKNAQSVLGLPERVPMWQEMEAILHLVERQPELAEHLTPFGIEKYSEQVKTEKPLANAT